MKLNKLNKKVVSYWILTRLFLFLIVLLGFISVVIFVPKEYRLACLLPALLFLLFICFYTFIMPCLEYKAYRYYFSDEAIIIKGGVFFKFYKIIPIIQVQDIGTFQGPIQILYRISNINIATAGSVEKIICLDQTLAKEIADEVSSKIHKRLIED